MPFLFPTLTNTDPLTENEGTTLTVNLDGVRTVKSDIICQEQAIIVTNPTEIDHNKQQKNTYKRETGKKQGRMDNGEEKDWDFQKTLENKEE